MDTKQRAQVALLDATPEKRIFFSIISDYDTITALKELIDNAVDIWTRKDRSHLLEVEIEADTDRQLITIRDNAGGVEYGNLRLLVTPGGSLNDDDAQTIGVFGVGSKRAVVALAEHVTIRTRHTEGKTHAIEISNEWLAHPDWELPAYEVSDIEPGSTVIELSKLRSPLERSGVDALIKSIGETYDSFLSAGRCNISVNGVRVAPVSFSSWAFPDGHPPRYLLTNLTPDGKGEVTAEITAGLIRDRDPSAENYGVYFYCNDRLVVKEMRSRDVGYFVSGEAGVPHPDISLCRVIVRLVGPPKLMPWTSSKAGINTSHPTFLALKPHVIKLCKYYSRVSRSLKKRWEDEVFPYDSGDMIEIVDDEEIDVKRLILPAVPSSRRNTYEQLYEKNKFVFERKPWTVGLAESVAAVDIIVKQGLETKNRIALIILDSCVEIALKEYLVHEPGNFVKEDELPKLFQRRSAVFDKVNERIELNPDVVAITKHYYDIRNKLIHERATTGVTNADIERYRAAVIEILDFLFNLRF